MNELQVTIVFLAVLLYDIQKNFLNHIYYLTNIISIYCYLFPLTCFNAKKSTVNNFYKISIWICSLIIEIWKIAIYVMRAWFSVMPIFIAMLLVTLGFTSLPFYCFIVSEFCLRIYFYIDYFKFLYFFHLFLLTVLFYPSAVCL